MGVYDFTSLRYDDFRDPRPVCFVAGALGTAMLASFWAVFSFSAEQ